jgi:hypothetical protein
LLKCWRTDNSRSWSLSRKPRAADGDPMTDAEKAIEGKGIGPHVLILLHDQQNPNRLHLSQKLLRSQKLQQNQRLLLKKTRLQTPA